MKYINLLLILITLIFSSCKTELEKLQLSGDKDLVYDKAVEYYEKGEYAKSQVLFEQVLGQLRGDERAENAYFLFAYCHYDQQKYLLANYYFDDFSSKFLNSDRREEADFMTIYSFYKLSPIYRLDQSYSLKAIDGFQLFVNTYPESSRVEECNKIIDELRSKLEEKAFAEGKLYHDLQRYEASIQVFNNAIVDYPESEKVEEMRFWVLDSKYLYAIKSIAKKQYSRLEETQKYYDDFIRRYPNSAFKKELVLIKKNIDKTFKEYNEDGYKI